MNPNQFNQPTANPQVSSNNFDSSSVYNPNSSQPLPQAQPTTNPALNQTNPGSSTPQSTKQPSNPNSTQNTLQIAEI